MYAHTNTYAFHALLYILTYTHARHTHTYTTHNRIQVQNVWRTSIVTFLPSIVMQGREFVLILEKRETIAFHVCNVCIYMCVCVSVYMWAFFISASLTCKVA